MKHTFTLEMNTDRILRCDHFAPREQNPMGIIIICHGYKGFKDWGFFPYAAEKLATQYHVVIMNFTHNGVGANLTEFTELEKFAKNTFSKEVEDLSFLNSAIQTGLTPIPDTDRHLPVYILGHSKGASSSLIYALDEPNQINGVICWNGSLKPNQLLTAKEKEQLIADGRTFAFNARTKQNMPIDKDVLDDLTLNEERFNLIDRAPHITFPVFIIQGTQDFDRLLQGSSEFVQQNEHIRWLKVAEGNHTFQAVHPFNGTTPQLEKAIELTLEALAKMAE